MIHRFKLAGSKPFDEYEEAKAAGVKTKPVIAGPFTRLKLLKYTGSKKCDDYVDELINAYKSYVSEFEKSLEQNGFSLMSHFLYMI